MAKAPDLACAEAIRSLYDDLVRAIQADIEDLYDGAVSKHLIENRSVALGPANKARAFLDTIMARVETDPESRGPYDDFIAILRKKGNLRYLADRIEKERRKLSQSKEKVDSGPDEKRKLVTQKDYSDSGHPPSQSVSEQNEYGGRFEDPPTPRPPTTYCDNLSPNHSTCDSITMPFPPPNQDPEESDNLQIPHQPLHQETQSQSAPPDMVVPGEASRTLIKELQKQILDQKKQIQVWKQEAKEQIEAKGQLKEKVVEVEQQLSEKEVQLSRKEKEIKKLEDDVKKLQEQLQEYDNTIKQREKEKRKYEKQIEELELKNQGLDKENQELKVKRDEASSEIEDLKSRVAALEKQQKAVEKELNVQKKNFEQELEMMQLQHENAMERLQKELYQEKLKTKERECEDLRRKSEIQEDEIKQLKEKLSRTHIT